MMNILLVHNAEAGADDTPPHHHMVDVIRRAGHTATAVTTRDNWRNAITDDHDLVVAAGGDGTVRRVALALAGRRLPMTILPLGTANNIATAMGLANVPLEDAVARWETAGQRSLDLLIASGPWGETALIEGLGLGVFASLMAALDARRNLELAHIEDTDEKIEAVIGRLRERLAEQPALDLAVTLDGRDIPGAFVLLEALNIALVGPNLHLAPEADPTDGLMDVVLVTTETRADLDRYLARRQIGETRPVPLPVERGKHLTLTWTGSAVHMDDKVWPGPKHAIPPGPAEISVRVDPGALVFFI